jgi:lysophospholipase L1-like esterase
LLSNLPQNLFKSAFLSVGAFLFFSPFNFLFRMTNETESSVRYLALGDSYTIGESVEQAGTFPFQLAGALEKGSGLHFSEIKVIAKTGWTTAELKDGIKRAKPKGPFQLVTLLIGVNNQYRGYDPGIYKKEFEELLLQAIDFAGGRKDRVIVVSIPDYGCTPFGAEMAVKIDKELREYNEMARQICSQKDVSWVDIFQVSKLALKDSNLIATDNLHPSADMYALWVKEILPVATNILKHP